MVGRDVGLRPGLVQLRRATGRHERRRRGVEPHRPTDGPHRLLAEVDRDGDWVQDERREVDAHHVDTLLVQERGEGVEVDR